MLKTDYLKNAQKQVIGGREINFVRCDRYGNLLSAKQLEEMNFTNSVIDGVVSEVAGRISAETLDGLYSTGFFTD